jgi:ribonuclease E
VTDSDRANNDTGTDRETTEPTSPPPQATGPAAEKAAAGARSRTRTRTRDAAGAGRAGRAAAGTRTADQASDQASDEPAPADGPPSRDDDGSRRRRRRGGRGRGRRGRGGGGGEADREVSDDDASTTTSVPAEAPAEQDRGVARDGEDDGEDAAVSAAIAKGGTRVAAKRARDGGRNGPRRGGRAVSGVSEEVRRALLSGPPRTMLVTSREDRTQIAVLEDRTLVEHYVTRKEDVTYVGNIYMGRVQNVLPGMEAAFLDIGKGRNGVLYAGEVLYDELDLEEGAAHRIENALKPGQTVLVQVTKDPMGTKGPRLTMHLSLAGRFLVLAPGSDLFGISRKLTDRERDRLRRIVKQVKPAEHGVIVRTAAEGATEAQLRADMERLLAKWKRVEDAAAEAKALDAVYEEPPLVVKVIRDTFGAEFVRCVVDDEDLYQQVRAYLEEVAPELVDRLELYGQPRRDAPAEPAEGPDVAGPDADAEAGGDGDADPATPDDGAPRDLADAPAASDDEVPPPLTHEELAAASARRDDMAGLFDAYEVTEQLRKAMARKVWLPSGGYLIIESTEAMKVIDVNTGKFTGGSDTNLEEVVLKTNLEAADEIVRQLRLRDMGGIIVIDFIDMLLKANQDQVVRRLKRELLRDRTKTRVSEVSRLGLVQMTRKNVSQGLVESFSHTCEACDGRGIVSELE